MPQVTSFASSPYGYTPTEWVCITFIVLFGVSTLIHTVQAVYTRLWWLVGTAAICGILEILGWSGRLWSSLNVDSLNPYIMQMTTTIIAPTPLIAANFVILGQIIRRLGPCYSRLSPLLYTIVFVSCDIVALVIQAVGGATAATAVESGNDPASGGHIMLGGIAFQLGAITIYMALATEFIVRCLWKKPVRKALADMEEYSLDRRVKLMLLSLAASSIFIYIRSIYRTIELNNGWDGEIIQTQVYFNVFDGTMIVLAMYTLNFLHPGFLLGPASTWRKNSRSPKVLDEEKSQPGQDEIFPAKPQPDHRVSDHSEETAVDLHAHA